MRTSLFLLFVGHYAKFHNIIIKRGIFKKEEEKIFCMWVNFLTLIYWIRSFNIFRRIRCSTDSQKYWPGFPIDSWQWYASRKTVFRDLTSDCSRRCLFDLRQLQIQQVVKKRKELLSSDEVSIVHHPDSVICGSRHFKFVWRITLVLVLGLN